MGALPTIDASGTSRVDTSFGESVGESGDERVRRATLTCIARFGLTKTTLDDIARESGVSRATIYRRFPGGRDVLFQSVIVREIDRFFAELAQTVGALDDLEDIVTAGLSASMRFLFEHAALRTIVQMEPGLLLPQFAFHRLDVVLLHAAGFAAPHLEPHLGSADDAWSAAEHLVRIVLSYAMYPSPSVDPFDDDSVRRLVRHHILPGLTPGSTDTDTEGTP